MNAPLHVPFPKRQRHPDPAARRLIQQGSGIHFFLPAAQVGQRLFVAGHFQIPPQQPVGQPHQRVHPVQAGDRPGRRLGQRVAAADVRPLVGQNADPFLPIQPFGQVDARPHQPQDEGSLQPGHLIYTRLRLGGRPQPQGQRQR